MFSRVNPAHRPSRREHFKTEYKILRPRVREETWLRDGQRCRCPCRRLLPLFSDTPLGHIHIHETETPRQEAAIDVSLRSTIALAPECHAAVESNRLKIVYTDDAQRCNGPVAFTGKLASGRVLDDPYISHPTLTGAWRIAE